MDVAHVVAQRASCPRRHVGAVLVLDHRIISTGYNGAPRGAVHCTEIGCKLMQVDGRESCQRAIHAEVNAVLNVGRVPGATLYVTAHPCDRCAAFLIQSGVIRVVWADDYPALTAASMLRAAGIQVDKLGAEVCRG